MSREEVKEPYLELVARGILPLAKGATRANRTAARPGQELPRTSE